MVYGVIEYPDEKRDGVVWRIASEAGCPHETAREFGATMEQTTRAYVAEIEARGGGTSGIA
jgi:hypothetical protein